MVTNKIYSSSDDVQDFLFNVFKETGLQDYGGVTLKVMSVTKSKSVLKLTKASPTTEFLLNKPSTIQVYVYEEAFDKLPDDAKRILAEMVFASVSYDLEKDKLNVDTNPIHQILSLRHKYSDNFNDILDKIELADIVIAEIEESRKEQKEADKMNKKNNRGRE